MKPFTREVIKAIQSIPRGKVATYGQIAAYAGRPRSARQVGRILHSMTRKHNLPWHRVIGSNGKILIKDPEIASEQRYLLEREKVEVKSNNSVDFGKYPW